MHIGEPTTIELIAILTSGPRVEAAEYPLETAQAVRRWVQEVVYQFAYDEIPANFGTQLWAALNDSLPFSRYLTSLSFDRNSMTVQVFSHGYKHYIFIPLTWGAQ